MNKPLRQLLAWGVIGVFCAALLLAVVDLAILTWPFVGICGIFLALAALVVWALYQVIPER